jgi:hypothetical protein
MRVSPDRKVKTEFREGAIREFFSSILRSTIRDAVKFIVAFAVGTGAAAIACW